MLLKQWSKDVNECREECRILMLRKDDNRMLNVSANTFTGRTERTYLSVAPLRRFIPLLSEMRETVDISIFRSRSFIIFWRQLFAHTKRMTLFPLFKLRRIGESGKSSMKHSIRGFPSKIIRHTYYSTLVAKETTMGWLHQRQARHLDQTPLQSQQPNERPERNHP